MTDETTRMWDSVLQYEKSYIMAQPTVSPGCTMGSVSVGALLRMAMTYQRYAEADPTAPAFAPTEERTNGDHNSYF